jgi:pilus assembly protein Flp/PilA
MPTIFRRPKKNKQGANTIEYVLIASLISLAAITAMGAVSGTVSNVLSNVANAMT